MKKISNIKNQFSLLPLMAPLLACGLVACGGGSDSTSNLSSQLNADPQISSQDIETAAILQSGSEVEIIPASQQTSDGVLEPTDGHAISPAAVSQVSANSSQDTVMRVAAMTLPRVVYTPANIRSAYNFPPLPVDFNNLTTVQKSLLGAGQTTYVITIGDNPNILLDLNIFSTKFNLPKCQQSEPPSAIAAIPATAAVRATLAVPAVTARAAVPASFGKPAVAAVIAQPAVAAQLAKLAQPEIPGVAIPSLPPASLHSCNLVVANSMTGPALTKTHAYDARWALETSLDVQWIHATAPLARIVVIQAHAATASAIGTAVQVANKFGPGIVNLSLTGFEGSYVNGFETLFQTPNMTYMAASGDFGTQANWPATSPSVIAVGGTSLRISTATQTRSEVTWTGSGGAISRYFPAPKWQDLIKIANAPMTLVNSPFPNVKGRVENDVAFNADPATGQYTVVTAPGKSNPMWYSMGGTSLATPQWVGIIAIANAQRALMGKGPLGNINNALYLTRGFSLTDSFFDITVGNHGTCSYCSAGTGYDVPTGWGSPNVSPLLKSLTSL